jgi:hypothetical protein
MVIDFEAMDWSKEYTYKDKKIYISYETKRYILCSYFPNGEKKFKIDKTKFDG